MGLEPVPGSGSQWHSKLDVHGLGARWSLKSTKFGSFPLSTDFFDELREHTQGPGGTGELPLGAIEINSGRDPEVVVVMPEWVFKLLASERLELVRESKAEARRRRASVPQLLRDDGDDAA